jgi:hypothetical protein
MGEALDQFEVVAEAAQKVDEGPVARQTMLREMGWANSHISSVEGQEFTNEAVIGLCD